MLFHSRIPRLNKARAARFALFSSIAMLTGTAPVGAQVPVLTQNRDNMRDGANVAETALTPAAVRGGGFGKLFTITGLNANVNGQPLFAPRVVIHAVQHNVLYLYTSNNADNSPCGLYAYDADTGARIWAKTFPNSATYTTATPVIDQARGIMYVLTKSSNDDTGLTYIHAVSIATGVDLAGSPLQVQASVAGTGDGSAGGKVYFDGDHGNGRFHANDRTGLLLLNGGVYAAFAHNSDSNPYHGWVLAYQYNGQAFTQIYVFCTTPNGSSSNTPGGGDGGVWQAGKGLTTDQAGHIFFSVGNGTFDANTGGVDYGMCYLKLNPNLKVIDYFSPFDEQTLSNQDLDTGNSGVVGIPGTTAAFAGATKFGAGFLLNANNMGHFTPGGPDHVIQRLNGISGNDSVGQNPIAWDMGVGAAKHVYLWPGGSELEQFDYNISTGAFSPAGVSKHTTGRTSGGSLAVSSHGGAGGVLWAVDNSGVLRAYDATDVSQPELWDSNLNSSRDSLGSVGHFQFPTVTNGKVYVPDNHGNVMVYGLLSPPSPLGATKVVQVRFTPRTGYASRMVGGVFQGSNDGVNYTTFATVSQTPLENQPNVLASTSATPYRYLRYLSPNGGYGDIAELEFDGGSVASPVALIGVPFGTPGTHLDLGNDYSYVFDNNDSTYFDAPAPGNGDFVGMDLGVKH